MIINVYTVVSDNRISDAVMLLNNLSQWNELKVHIIPFENCSSELQHVAEKFNAVLVDPDPYWDELGKSIFGDHLYRPKVLAWKYFRKLNAISHSSCTPFIFLDANVLLASNPGSILKKLNRKEMVFGSRAMKNRNFTSWGKDIANFFNPNIGEGFNAGFWGALENPFDRSVFDIFRNNGEMIKPMLTLSPEQSVLSLAIAFSQIKPYLINELDVSCANLVSAESSDTDDLKFFDSNSLSFRDKKVVGLKWTGRNIALPKEHVAEIFRDKFREQPNEL